MPTYPVAILFAVRIAVALSSQVKINSFLIGFPFDCTIILIGYPGPLPSILVEIISKKIDSQLGLVVHFCLL